jgi:hypothetical protein
MIFNKIYQDGTGSMILLANLFDSWYRQKSVPGNALCRGDLLNDPEEDFLFDGKFRRSPPS